jgi:hypothetical protein
MGEHLERLKNVLIQRVDYFVSLRVR